MISYELAKKIKDAGFPKSGNGRYIPNNELSIQEFNYFEIFYIPTLEEAIEACDDKFIDLNRIKSKPKNEQWAACCYDLDDPAGKGIYYGQTPLEAVLNLWLALNTKTNEN